MESILTSTKKLLGIEEDDTNFDTDIIMHINSTFFVLEQIGVNPGVFFEITDKEKLWEDYLTSGQKLALVKSYMYLKVRLIFDPPSIGSVLDAMKTQAAEMEWRIMISVDPKPVEIITETEEDVYYG